MKTLAKPWSWKGLEPGKRDFGKGIRKVFKEKRFIFKCFKGSAAKLAGPGSSKLHIPDYELAPIDEGADEGGDDALP